MKDGTIALLEQCCAPTNACILLNLELLYSSSRIIREKREAFDFYKYQRGLLYII